MRRTEDQVVLEVHDIIDLSKISNLVCELRVGQSLERTNILAGIQVLLQPSDKSELTRYREACVVQDFVWEKLNTGHWKEVWRGWRDLYAVVALIRLDCILKLITSKPEIPLCQEPIVVKNCDNKPKVPETPVESQPRESVSECAEGLLDKETKTTEKNPVEESALAGSQIIEDLVRIADFGLLLGGPVLDHSLERIAELLTEFLSQESLELPEKYPRPCEPDFEIDKVSVKLPAACVPLKEVQTILEPSIEQFITDFKLTETPVVIRGCLSDWGASSGPRAWSVDRLVRAAGPRTVPVEIGSSYTHQQWTQKLMTIREFAERYLSEGAEEIGYLAQHQLLEQVPELGDDICIPDYCYTGEEEDVDINTWIGPKGTVSPLHTDPKHNLLSQVCGTKYVVLYPAGEGDNLYPHPSPLLFNTSQVDLQHPDLDQFPRFSECTGWHTLLRPGEMLYIPPRTWHFVKGLSTSFSVSFWWK